VDETLVVSLASVYSIDVKTLIPRIKALKTHFYGKNKKRLKKLNKRRCWQII